MNQQERSCHLDPLTFRRWDGGGPPSAAEAAHLAHCPDCMAAFAGHDPLGPFRLLNALPPACPVPPLPALEYPGPAPLGAAWKSLLAAAAAAVAAAALWFAVRPAAPSPPVLAQAGSLPPVVGGIGNPGAEVVTLVPPGGEGPSVTLLVGVEIDL